MVEIGDHDSLLRDYPSGIYAKLAAADAKAQAAEETKPAEEEDEKKEDDLDPALLAQINPALVAAAKANKDKAADGRKKSVQLTAKDITEKDPVAKAKL